MRANLSLNKSYDNVLIIVSHTDDETLGMGGVIAKHIKSGDNVSAISMTDGLSSRGEISQNEIQNRKNASAKASNILGFNWIKKGNFPDNQMDSIAYKK